MKLHDATISKHEHCCQKHAKEADAYREAFESMQSSLSLLAEVCAAMADSEHCMHVQAKRMSREAWADMRHKAKAALALAEKVRP